MRVARFRIRALQDKYSMPGIQDVDLLLLQQEQIDSIEYAKRWMRAASW
jgi:hypothetical protein